MDRRILFLSLEFNFSPFSGNGVLARSLVTSLVRSSGSNVGNYENDVPSRCVKGDHPAKKLLRNQSGSSSNTNAKNDGEIQVRVICGKPHPSTPHISTDIEMDSEAENLEIWPVHLPSQCHWKKLDRSGPWKEFASACGGSIVEDCDNKSDFNFRNRIKEFQPTDVVAVDWHGMLAWESICRSFSGSGNPSDDSQQSNKVMDVHSHGAWTPDDAVVCYYNFRVYSSSSYDHSSNAKKSMQTLKGALKSDDQFHREMEQISCRLANGILCLSEHDRALLARLMEEDALADKIKTIDILPPPLRGDIWELANNFGRGKHDSDDESYIKHLPLEARSAIEILNIQQLKHTSTPLKLPKRVFLTCIVRLSPEKTPHHFISLLRKLGGLEFLRSRGLIPVLCGSRIAGSYSQKVINDFRSLCSNSHEGKVWPCVVIDHFIGPKELAAIFSCTALNVHPCLYDAYGMTLVESAAFGVPSIVSKGGKVGAVSLLGEGKGCIGVDLEKILDEPDAAEADADRFGEDTDDIKELLRLIPSLDQQTLEHSAESESNCQNGSISMTKIAEEGRVQALDWDEMACCRGLLTKLSGLHT